MLRCLERKRGAKDEREEDWLEEPSPQKRTLFRFLTLDFFFTSLTMRAHLAASLRLCHSCPSLLKDIAGRKTGARQPVLFFTFAPLTKGVFGMWIFPGVQLEAMLCRSVWHYTGIIIGVFRVTFDGIWTASSILLSGVWLPMQMTRHLSKTDILGL